VLVDNTGANWLDFTNIGFNKKWIVAAGNLFSNTSGNGVGAQVYIFSKAAILAGPPTITPTIKTQSNAFTLCPALTYDTTRGSLFCIENYNGVNGQLKLWKIAGNVGSETLTSVGYSTSTALHWGGNGNGGGDFAPQLGTTNKIQNNDDRINNCVHRNGRLWCSYNAFLPVAAPNRTAIMWWQIDTTGIPLQIGKIDDPTAAQFYAFPSIAVNQYDDALIGYTMFSSAIHPSCAYSFHSHTDPIDSIRPLHMFRAGQTSYYQTFGGGENRWGDYSGTCVDPRNDADFWTLQECSYTSANNWDTWWAHYVICPTPLTPTISPLPAAPCIGANATYTAPSDTGAHAYTWTVSGTGWTGSSTTSSLVATAGTGVGTITVSAQNSCGSSSTFTFNVTPATVPAAPTITTTTAPCPGTITATYTASPATLTSYIWQALGTGWAGTSTTSTLNATVGTDSALIIVQGINACGTGAADTFVSHLAVLPDADTAINVPTTLCSGSTITVTTPIVPNATSYLWTVSGTGWSGTSTTNSITLTVGTAPATITVNGVNNCGNGTSFSVSNVTPTATFSVATHITTNNIADIVTYTGNAPASATYTWNFGGGVATPGGTTQGPQSVVWNTPGTKTITLTVSYNGCTSTVYSDTVHVNNPVSIEELNNLDVNAIDIVPNPNNGSFDIQFNQNFVKPILVKILDVQGRTVFTNEFEGTNNNKVFVSTRNLSAGIYTATITINGVVFNKKVVINK
ncbi:MAG: T9SS type A sorting domain-containing protein, partial [Bacteroidota bacterium]